MLSTTYLGKSSKELTRSHSTEFEAALDLTKSPPWPGLAPSLLTSRRCTAELNFRVRAAPRCRDGHVRPPCCCAGSADLLVHSRHFKVLQRPPVPPGECSAVVGRGTAALQLRQTRWLARGDRAEYLRTGLYVACKSPANRPLAADSCSLDRCCHWTPDRTALTTTTPPRSSHRRHHPQPSRIATILLVLTAFCRPSATSPASVAASCPASPLSQRPNPGSPTPANGATQRLIQPSDGRQSLCGRVGWCHRLSHNTDMRP